MIGLEHKVRQKEASGKGVTAVAVHARALPHFWCEFKLQGTSKRRGVGRHLMLFLNDGHVLLICREWGGVQSS